MGLPPQVEQAIVKVDEFIAQYPSLTQYGMCMRIRGRARALANYDKRAAGIHDTLEWNGEL
jgi:hypothetical protein